MQMKQATVRVGVLVMPTPPLWNSVQYARPSSRTAMPKAGGVVTLSTSSPLGCVFGSQLGAATSIRTPGVAGGNGACAVGGDLSDAHAQNDAAPQLRSRPAIVVRCMRASRDVGRETANRPHGLGSPKWADRPTCNPHSRMCRPVNTFCGFGVAS